MKTSISRTPILAGAVTAALLAGIAALPFALADDDAASEPDAAQADAPDPALVARGQRLYLFCRACHATEADPGDKIGPHLAGIVDRPVAALEGWPYSDAMKEQDFAWSEEKLDLWLERPSTLVPGTSMSFVGIPKEENRAALIAYLKTL